MPDAAVVARHVLEHPVDGVVGVGGFVDRLGVLGIARRPHHDELALGLEPAADVLEDEDVAVLGELLVLGRHRGREAVGIMTEPIRRARETIARRPSPVALGT